MGTKITYEDGYGSGPVTIELGRRDVRRESGCRDVALSRMLAIDCPLKLCVLVRSDGSVDEWYAEFAGSGDNTYWHLDHGADWDAEGKYGIIRELTPAQRETLIRIWGGQIRPFGMRGTTGAPVMRWVNPTEDEVERVLGSVPALA